MNATKGKVALVTGAARGIGAAVARQLAADGAVVVMADVLETDGEAAAAAIRAQGGQAHYRALDVTSEPQWRALVQQVCRDHGGLDIVVNNAGLFLMRPLEECSTAEWERLERVNVDGVFLGTKYGILGMTELSTSRPQGGAIVNVASIAALLGDEGSNLYCLTKGAVVALTRTAAVECGRAGNGVRINAVCPGATETPMLNGIFQQRLGTEDGPVDPIRAKYARVITMGRTAQPEELASAVVFLATDASSYCTGTTVVADGGFTAA